MNIIFGDSRDNLPNNYTVLELDTFKLPPDGATVTAYCVLEKVSLQDFPLLQSLTQLHSDVMANFKLKHWDYCETAIREGLIGKLGGEVDSFYQELLNRIESYRLNPPPDNWDSIIDRTTG